MGHELPSPPSDLIDRKLGPEDVVDYIKFDDDNFFVSETPADHEPPHWTAEDIEEAMKRGDLFGALTTEAGDWAATYWFKPEADKSSLYVANLVVRPDYRDKGVGASLLQKAEAVATNMGLKNCELSVDPLNSRGMNLYLKHDYLVTGYLSDDPDGLTDWLHMSKALEGDRPKLDHHRLTRVHAGDKATLWAVLSAGYIGFGMKVSEDNDPKRNIIELAPAAK